MPGIICFFMGAKTGENTHLVRHVYGKWGSDRSVRFNAVYWTGKWPEERSPGINDYQLDGKTAYDNIYLTPGQQVEAQVYPKYRTSHKIKIDWEVYKESTDLKEGGDREEKPPIVEGLIRGSENEIESGSSAVKLNAPKDTGPYRIFVYLKDEEINRVATANIPFYVQD